MKPKRYHKSLCIKLSSQSYEKLKEMSDSNEVSCAALIRQMIQNHISNKSTD